MHLDIRVISNTATDTIIKLAQELALEFQDVDWRLNTTEIPFAGKIGKLSAGAKQMADTPVLALDAGVKLAPQTVRKLVDAISTGELDIVSGDLQYLDSANRIVQSFSRAYSSAPYARSNDLKGKCVLFSPQCLNILRNAPDVIADDRYFLSQVPRNRRQKIRGAVVGVFPRPSTGPLIMQQSRWISSNRLFDTEYPAYQRNEHETGRRRYFGPNPPALRDQITYFAVMSAAQAHSRIRPQTNSRW